MSIDTSWTQHISHNGNGNGKNGKTPVATHTIYLALGSNLGDRRGNLYPTKQGLEQKIDAVVAPKWRLLAP